MATRIVHQDAAAGNRPMNASPVNIVALATSDLTTAAAILRKPRGGVEALDIRYLAGAARAQRISDAAFDVYLRAFELGLRHMRGLTTKGYYVRRSTP